MSTDLILKRNNFLIYNACKAGNWKKAIKTILDANGKLTSNYKPIKNFDQWTALHWAAASSTPAYDACKILLTKAEYSSTCKSRTNETPLDLAILRGHENIIELLTFHSPESVSMRENSIPKRIRKLVTKDASFQWKRAVHIVPVPYPDMEPDDDGFQTFDQLVSKFSTQYEEHWGKKFKFPKSKYLP